MSKASHTPGEWLSNGGTVRIVDENSITIRFIARVAGGFGCAEKAANARLIAAAPELLEAVLRARRHAENIGITDGSYIAQLDAAIAKAEGRHDV